MIREENITVIIDGKECKGYEGETVMHLAERNGIKIPHFCYHEDLPINGSCRICLVEVFDEEKGNKVVTSCTLKVKDGLKIETRSEKTEELRKANLELLLGDHKKYCPHCKRDLQCDVADLMKEYGITGDEYNRDEDLHNRCHKMLRAAEIDPKLCINCNRCVEICNQIGIGYLELDGKASKHRITYNKDPKVDCIYCGQCTNKCPTNAVREQSHIEGVIEALKDPSKIVIAQTAPSVRTSIGEEFGMPFGINAEGKLFTAYRKLGFDKVFDVNFGADITTFVEAQELVERIKNNEEYGIGKKMPMFTSCCPGWVKNAEFYHPEIIPNLTTARSPQIHSGGAYKSWWAELEGVDPKDIVIVSLMPCTSKKNEATAEELQIIDDLQPVDYSLTTRELAKLIKAFDIDFPNLEESGLDSYGEYSGASVIYGASGGVMESALRSAQKMLTGKDLENFELKPVRTGVEGFKTARVEINGKTLNVAVVATPKQVARIVEELKEDPHAYDYIEVMACIGGCLGGGGQPKTSTFKVLEERRKGLYRIDDKKEIRAAHLNPNIQAYMSWISEQPEEVQEKLLYRDFRKREKFE